MSEEELDHLYEFYIELSKLAEDSDLTSTHSIDAAAANHRCKLQYYIKKK